MLQRINARRLFETKAGGPGRYFDNLRTVEFAPFESFILSKSPRSAKNLTWTILLQSASWVCILRLSRNSHYLAFQNFSKYWKCLWYSLYCFQYHRIELESYRTLCFWIFSHPDSKVKWLEFVRLICCARGYGPLDSLKINHDLP